MYFRVYKDRVKRKTDTAFVKRAKGLVAGFLAFLFCINLGRIGWIMAFHGEEYRQAAVESQLYDQTIDAIRGTIYDRNMTPLVTSTSAWILCANPNEIRKVFSKYDESHLKEYYSYLSKGLAKILGLKAKEVKKLIKKENSQYVRIRKEITPSEKIALQAFLEEEYVFYVTVETSSWGKTKTEEKKRTIKPASCFSYENDSTRVYAQSHLASTVLGVVNDENNGVTGLESYYNSTLTGESGRIVTAKDSRGQVLDSSFETVFDASEGNGVVTTIDQNIQSYLENALEQAKKNINSESVYGIVMDVDTGAVLAMSEKPDFDLTNPGTLNEYADTTLLKTFEKGSEEYNEEYSRLLYEQWSSACVTDTYEPGSTFKIFGASAAIEEGTASLNTTYNCVGYNRIKDITYHCANSRAHGHQTLTQMLMNSCNCGFINVGQTLGIERYMKYFEAFGFTERTGIDIGNEAYPYVHNAETMSVVDLASTSFGQTFRITPLQLITATCAIANGGKLMKPYLVQSVVDGEGNIVSQTEPTVVRNVISQSTSQKVVSMMEAVVEAGTGKNAYLAGYRVAGKTATAQKLDDSAEQEIYVASFVCFAPADDPEVAILICVDNGPGEIRGGGALAAPIAKDVMSSTLSYLNIEPRYTESELKKISGTTPSLTGKNVSQAKIAAAAEGYVTRVVGNGDTVISQVPAARQTIPSGGVIVLYTETDMKAQEVEVPDFSGLTVSQVNSLAVSKGINAVFSGPTDASGTVSYSQDFPAGAVVEAGSRITVYFKAEVIDED